MQTLQLRSSTADRRGQAAKVMNFDGLETSLGCVWFKNAIVCLVCIVYAVCYVCFLLLSDVCLSFCLHGRDQPWLRTDGVKLQK